MEASAKNLTVVVGTTKRVADIAVSLEIQFPGVSEKCLQALLSNCQCGHEKGSEEAALAYALFEVIRDKLISSPFEISKTRVSGVKCLAIGQTLTISWNCQGTGSTMRKTCSLAVSCLNPIKLFSKYSENVKFLTNKGGKKEEFNFCVRKMVEGIKKRVLITTVGKINLDASKLKDIVTHISSKIPASETPGANESVAPTTPQKEEKETAFPIVKSAGIGMAAVADYIRTNSGGMGVSVSGHGVVVYNHSWVTKSKQLSDKRRITDFVEKKYSKLGDEFPNLFAYFSIVQNYATAETALKMIKSKTKPNEVLSAINTALH